MTAGIIHDHTKEKQSTEKHMGGCIAGFFHFFDRNHAVSSKCLCPKRHSPSGAVDSDSGSSFGSLVLSSEFEGLKPREPAKLMASPDRHITPTVTATTPLAKSPLAVSSLEVKEGIKSPSKFKRELPRLSLDSRLHPRGIRTTSSAAGGDRYDDSIDRANEDGKRSPSIVARLMGLEPPHTSPHSGGGNLPEKKAELRRSASESRSRDGNLLLANTQYKLSSGLTTSETREKSNGGRYLNSRESDHGGCAARNPHPEALKPRKIMAQQQQRKKLYDYGDFFPEPKPAVSSIYGDVEKRLKMRGIEEPSKDLETLKQILEALQFKGLLRNCKPPRSQTGRRNFVYEQRFPYEESPIVVMKPAKSPRKPATEPSSPRFQSKTVPRRNLNVVGEDPVSSRSPRRNPTSPGRSVSPRKKGALSIETQRSLNETTSTDARRFSPVQSPRTGSRRLDQTASQSPRRRGSTAEVHRGLAEDELSTISESSLTTSSRTDTEKSKTEEFYKDSKSLLERCDKLLSSIAEMSSAPKNSTELQQSPVSILDSSLYKEDESPSPVMKRAIDFKDMEDEIWSSSSSDEYPDFAYVSEIIKASNHLSNQNDVFSLLEKKQSIKGRNTSKSSILQRRLIFDTITEILNRNRQQVPWTSVSCRPQLKEMWSELQRIQKRDESEDMFEIIRGVMKRDLTQDSINGWGECQLESSEAVLDVERLIYKDLIGETIQDLMGFSGSCRKLVF